MAPGALKQVFGAVDRRSDGPSRRLGQDYCDCRSGLQHPNPKKGNPGNRTVLQRTHKSERRSLPIGWDKSSEALLYCCDEYQRIAKRYNLKISMTESYNPYANAVAERVNDILKLEFGLEELRLSLREQRQVVSESIGIYNALRPYYSYAMLTPNQMHRQREMKIKTYRRKLELPASNSN